MLGDAGRRSRAMLPHRVAEYIARHALFGPGEGILVAVSGGPDSVALLCCLSELGGEWGLDLTVGRGISAGGRWRRWRRSEARHA